MNALINNSEQMRSVRAKLNATLNPFPSRADFEASLIPAPVILVYVVEGGVVYQLVKTDAGDWVSGDGAKWQASIEASLSASEFFASVNAAANSASSAAASAAEALVSRQAAEAASASASVIVGSGNGKFENGTQSEPSISFVLDPDTGIRRIEEDAVAITTGGRDRVTVDALGRVAVGFSTPEAILHTLSTSSPGGIMADAVGSVLAQFIGRRARGTPAAPEAVVNGDNLVALAGFGYDGTQYGNGGGQIVIRAAEEFTPVANGGFIDFLTAPIGSTTRQNRMRISPEGNVGINTGSAPPSERLHVEGNALINGAVTGTAVTQSLTDTTTGRLLKVGDYGWGSIAPSVSNANALDAILTNQRVRVQSASVATVNGPSGAFGGVCDTYVFGSGNAYQEYREVTGNFRMYRRAFASGAWSPWVHVPNQTLGTVSQSGGVPTGAVIERGSNANGEFVRFADGTQICTLRVTHSLAITTAFIGGFRSNANTWTFPAAFTSSPEFGATVIGLSAFGVVGSTSSSGTAAAYAFTAVTSQATASDRIASLYAIGRWF